MKFGEAIHVLGTVVAIALGCVTLYWQISDSTERLSLRPSDGVPGNFHLFSNGVSQEAEFVAVNEGAVAVIIQRVEIMPGNTFPARVLINGEFWDGRPFRMEPNDIIVFRYLAREEFNFWNTKEAKNVKAGEPLNSAYLNLFNSFDHSVASKDRMDVKLQEQIPFGLDRLYESYLVSELQDALFKSGYTFEGEHPEVARELSKFSMAVTFGGPCLSYMVHTLSVCVGMELITLEGNTFASDYLGFGMRSLELDRMFEAK